MHFFVHRLLLMHFFDVWENASKSVREMGCLWNHARDVGAGTACFLTSVHTPIVATQIEKIRLYGGFFRFKKSILKN